MVIIAASLYLPEHITTMLSRAWFYYAGDETAAAGLGSGSTQQPPPSPMDGKGMEGGDVLDMLGRM